jgi:hypothetical protein
VERAGFYRGELYMNNRVWLNKSDRDNILSIS